MYIDSNKWDLTNNINDTDWKIIRDQPIRPSQWQPSPWQDIELQPTQTTLHYTDHNGNQVELIKEILDLKESMAKIKERLAILDKPDQDIMEKYPALREAYNYYLAMEKLCLDEEEKKKP